MTGCHYQTPSPPSPLFSFPLFSFGSGPQVSPGSTKKLPKSALTWWLRAKKGEARWLPVWLPVRYRFYVFPRRIRSDLVLGWGKPERNLASPLFCEEFAAANKNSENPAPTRIAARSFGGTLERRKRTAPARTSSEGALVLARTRRRAPRENPNSLLDAEPSLA